MGKESIIVAKSYDFALRVIHLSRSLRQQRDYELASQLLRSGTSIGANIEEARAGSSRADFVAKMSIASKEAREAHYWLRLLRDSQSLPEAMVNPMIRDSEELIRLLIAIVKTTQSRK